MKGLTKETIESKKKVETGRNATLALRKCDGIISRWPENVTVVCLPAGSVRKMTSRAGGFQAVEPLIGVAGKFTWRACHKALHRFLDPCRQQITLNESARPLSPACKSCAIAFSREPTQHRQEWRVTLMRKTALLLHQAALLMRTLATCACSPTKYVLSPKRRGSLFIC